MYPMIPSVLVQAHSHSLLFAFLLAAEMNKENPDLKQALEAAKATNEMLQERLDESATKLKSIQEENKRLQKDNTTWREIISALKTGKTNLLRRYNKLKTEMNGLKLVVDGLKIEKEEEVQKLQAEKKEWIDQIYELNNALNAKSEECNRLQTQLRCFVSFHCDLALSKTMELSYALLFYPH